MNPSFYLFLAPGLWRPGYVLQHFLNIDMTYLPQFHWKLQCIPLSFYKCPITSFYNGIFCSILFHSPNNVATYLCAVLSLHSMPFGAWELTIHSHFSITMETGDRSLLILSNKLQWLSAFLRYMNLYYCNENNRGKSHSHKLGILSSSTTFVMEIRAGGSRLASFLSSDSLFLSFLNAILIFPFSFIFSDINGC